MTSMSVARQQVNDKSGCNSRAAERAVSLASGLATTRKEVSHPTYTATMLEKSAHKRSVEPPKLDFLISWNGMRDG